MSVMRDHVATGNRMTLTIDSVGHPAPTELLLAPVRRLIDTFRPEYVFLNNGHNAI